MTSTNTYMLILTKSNKIHYISRYIKFINLLKHQQKQKGVTEHHHILPKCKDLFPEYKSLHQNSWNGIHLTKRQHFIAHWMLHKIFGSSQTRAFWLMCRSRKTISSRIYELLKLESSQMISKINKGNSNGKGYKFTEEQKQSSAERKKKITEFISPDGTIYIHKGFADFCILHNLKLSMMRRVVLGIRPHHKGWKCKYI